MKIPGFYDDVVPPTTSELEDLKNSGFTTAAFKKDHQFKSLRVTDPIESHEADLVHADIRGARHRRRLPGAGRQDRDTSPRHRDRLLPARSRHGREEDREAGERFRQGEESRTCGWSRSTAFPPTRDTPRARTRRHPGGDEVRFRQGPGVRPRGRLDRRRGVDGEGAEARRCSSSVSHFPSTDITLPTRTTTGSRRKAE